MLARLLAAAACAAGLAAQDAAPAKAFDVASIRQTKNPLGGSGALSLASSFKGGTLTFRSITLTILIAQAYDVQRARIEGCPAWCNEDWFDVIAKTDLPNARVADATLMLQALLAERFKLVLRRTRQELPGYALVVGKNGPKLPLAKDDEVLGFSTAGAVLNFRKMPLSGLASYLAGAAQAPVEDHTGLRGAYDFTIDPTAYVAAGADALAPDPGSRFERLRSAVEDQLGLKLEPRKVPVENLVVVSVDHPSGN